MIDFSRPFQRGFEQTSKILFRPFDIGKCFVLGFSAWLATFLSGSFSANFNGLGNGFGNNSHDPKLQREMSDLFAKALSLGLPFWLMIVAVIALVSCLYVFIRIILGSRGQFMFLDNVRTNQTRIVEPWKEFAAEANSLTLWHLLLSLIPMIILFVLLGFALAHFWPDILTRTSRPFMAYLPWILALFGAVLLFIPVKLISFFLREFGVPLMAKNRYPVSKAFSDIVILIRSRPVDCLVFLFLRICMGVGFMFISMIAICLTCCLVVIPYLNAVILLPYHVFRQSFTLECLAQFGPEYNLWPVVPPPPFPPSSLPKTGTF